MKVKYSALMSDARGKLNGSVASKNRYGNYLRNKVTPVNPQTTFQMAQRQLLGSLSSAWRGLTAAARASWNAGTVNFPFTDIFGDVKHLSGQTLFIKLNANLTKVGEAQITSAPLPVGIPTIAVSDGTGTVAAGEIDALTVEINSATVPAGSSLVVYATPPVAPGITFVKNRFRFIGVGEATASVVDLLPLFSDRFGDQSQAGQRVFVRLAFVDNATGQQGVPVEAVITLA